MIEHREQHLDRFSWGVVWGQIAEEMSTLVAKINTPASERPCTRETYSAFKEVDFRYTGIILLFAILQVTTDKSAFAR